MTDVIRTTGGPLPYVLRRPADGAGPHPVLVFLHGYDEGAPTGLVEGVTRHGPLRADNPRDLSASFVTIAPQLPTRGDIWRDYEAEVAALVETIVREEGGDRLRLYLTGFSFGGNGVFDLALLQGFRWTALWAVDPTRVPPRDPALPVWVSIGEVARHRRDGFVRALGLQPPAADRMPARIYVDEQADHVRSATLAYRDARIYAWLLSHTK